MDDDFNTPEAMAVLFELAGEANRGVANARQMLSALAGILGLLQRNADDYFKYKAGSAIAPIDRQGGDSAAGVSEGEIEALIAARQTARKDRNFAESDRIRDTLRGSGGYSGGRARRDNLAPLVAAWRK